MNEFDIDKELAELRRLDNMARMLLEEWRSHDWHNKINLKAIEEKFSLIAEQAAKIAKALGSLRGKS